MISGGLRRAWLVIGATDMRKSFEGLAGIVESIPGAQLTSGDVFMFCNRSRTRLKALYWDGSGLWCCTKRLERGRFRWFKNREGKPVLSLNEEELMMIVKGLDPADFHQKKWFRMED
jgi:transposase